MSDAMALDEKSILARQDPDSWSRDPEEDIALLNTRFAWRTNNRNKKYRKLSTWMWAIVPTIVTIILVFLYSRKQILVVMSTKNSSLAVTSTEDFGLADTSTENSSLAVTSTQDSRRNLIFMVSDGMGPAAVSLTRGFKLSRHDDDTLLDLDRHFVGTHRTRSANSLVTDSAAGATAFTCGVKTNLGFVSVLPDETPCGSVLEAAKRKGYRTGIVVTTLATDATPATFASHVLSRQFKHLIAEQLIGVNGFQNSLDLIIGGGRCHFLPHDPNFACSNQELRRDGQNLIQIAQDEGWTYVGDTQGLYRENIEPPFLALLDGMKMPYEIDRARGDPGSLPSLAEMTQRALELLNDWVEKDIREGIESPGFFLMVEGSQIDNTEHDNDPAALVHEVLAYDRAFTTARTFLTNKGLRGNVISTSDHETGGLSAGRQNKIYEYPSPYRWHPERLINVEVSARHLADVWQRFLLDNPAASDDEKWLRARELLARIAPGPTGREIQSILDFERGPGIRAEGLRWPWSNVLSQRAEVGWSTHGHSGVDVNVYALSTHLDKNSKSEQALKGNRENSYIGRFLTRYLDVRKEQNQVTIDLRNVRIRPDPLPNESTLDIESGGGYDD